MDVSVTIPNTPSLINSNLTASDKYFAYVSNAAPSPKVILVDKRSLTDPNGPTCTESRYRDELQILHVNYISLGSEWFLVLGVENSLQVWNDVGTRLLVHINKDDLRLPPTAQVMFQASGKLGENVIAAGSSTGSLHFLKLRGDSSLNFDKEEATQSQHSSSITALTCYGSMVVTGDGVGSIGFWKKFDNWSASLTPAIGVPATCCAKLDKMVYFGFAFGQIRAYNVLSEKVLFEIGAHARGVMAISAHPSSPFLVSVGEDCCLNVWNVQNESVGLVTSKLLQNCVLCGVSFYKNGVAAAIYDRLKLVIITDLGQKT